MAKPRKLGKVAQGWKDRHDEEYRRRARLEADLKDANADRERIAMLHQKLLAFVADIRYLLDRGPK